MVLFVNGGYNLAMTERGLSRANLISLLALVFLVAIVAVTPETREIWSRLRGHVEVRKAERAAARAQRMAEAPPAEPEKLKEETETPAEQPPPPHVLRGEDGKLYPEPGYKWLSPDSAEDLTVYWAPHSSHPDHPFVFASVTEGQWRPAPGYDWVNPDGVNDLRVEWRPGKPHPEFENVVADKELEKWTPAPGYEWVNPASAHDMSVQPVSPPPAPDSP